MRINRYTISYTVIYPTQSDPQHTLLRYMNACIEQVLSITLVIMTLFVTPIVVGPAIRPSTVVLLSTLEAKVEIPEDVVLNVYNKQ
jgi:hypothetical protein